VCNHDKILPPITMMRGKLRIMENHLYPKRGIIENAYTSFEVYRFFDIPHLGYIVFCIYTPFFSSKIYPVLNYYFICIYILYRKKYIPRLRYIFMNRKKNIPRLGYIFNNRKKIYPKRGIK
jgi:hypothetical protein